MLKCKLKPYERGIGIRLSELHSTCNIPDKCCHACEKLMECKPSCIRDNPEKCKNKVRER